jgi:hypothetical protein
MAHEDPADTALSAAAAQLAADAALALSEHPLVELQAGLQRAGALLGALGPDGRGPAATLARREDYLSDAAVLLRGELTRLGVARAAPAESDLGVALSRTRDALAYLGEITADLLPTGLCPTLAGHPATHAPRLLRRVLEQLREVCELAEQVAERTAATLRGPNTGRQAPPEPAAGTPLAQRRGEIEALIAALRN